MKTQISVYDANPSQHCCSRWPNELIGVVKEGRISESAKRRIASKARRCGEYEAGDRLWMIARDQDGIIAAESVIRL